MQKRAKKHTSGQYEAFFAPLPDGNCGSIYFDRRAVSLPYAENFPKLHYHDRYEIGICEKGEGIFICDGEFASVSKGDLIFIAPKKRHFSRSLKENEICMCRFAYIDPLALISVLQNEKVGENEAILESARRIPPIIRASEYPRAASELQYIMELCSPSKNDRSLSVCLRLCALLLEAKELFSFGDICKKATEDTASDQLASQVSQYVFLHYKEQFTSKELAMRFHLSESQLRRKFVAAYGIPPMAYRSSLRCRIAGELLLRTQLSVSEIAADVGYGSPSDLYRAFFAEYGISPSEYRKRRQ